MKNIESGGVDENVDGAEGIADPSPEQARLPRIGQIRVKTRVPRARKTCEARRGGLAVIAIVNRNLHTALRKLQSDDAADAARGTGHQRDLLSVSARRLAPSRS